MEDIQKLYEIDEQLKYLEQEKHHRCLDTPYKLYNISVRNPITYGYDMDNYISSGNFPKSEQVYVHNDNGYLSRTDLYANSLREILEYAYTNSVQEFSVIKIGFGDNEKILNPSYYCDEKVGDSETTKEEELQKAFICIFRNYPLLDDKLLSLIESLDTNNILMVEQILIGMNKEQ